MPVVLRQDGYKVFFYSDEGDPREPPHVHIRKGGAEAKLWLLPFPSFENSVNFNPSELRAIMKLIEGSKDQLVEAWHEHFGS